MGVQGSWYAAHGGGGLAAHLRAASPSELLAACARALRQTHGVLDIDVTALSSAGGLLDPYFG